jgi:hypothetical protein
MEDYDKTGQMFEHECSPEFREQLDAIYESTAKNVFSKKRFKREFTGLNPDELEAFIAFWQEIADAFLLYRKWYADGGELKRSEAQPILVALSGLVAISFDDDSDDLNEVLVDFDVLTEDVRWQLMSCMVKTHEAANAGEKIEELSCPDDVAHRIWVDHYLRMLEQLRSLPSRKQVSLASCMSGIEAEPAAN